MPHTHMAAHLSSLHTYPVKALHGLSCQSLPLLPWGPEHDRRWLVTSPDGQFLTQRTVPAMATLQATPTADGLHLTCATAPPCAVPYPAPTTPTHPVRVWKDTVQAQDAGEPAALWLSTQLGQPCRLVYMPTPQTDRIRSIDNQPTPVSFADGYPVLVATTASLADLNTRLAAPVPMARFRPNLVIANTAPWAEDTWRKIKIGSVVLRLSAPCSRCRVTTIDQATGLTPNGTEPLATLATFHRTASGIMFAQNAVVEQTGVVHVGQTVEVLEQGPSNLTPPA